MPIDIADPRPPPAPFAAAHAPFMELARASLAATSASRGAEIDQALTGVLAERLRAGDASLLADALAAAPSVAMARTLWRRLIDAWGLASRAAAGEGVAATLFALPVIVVVGSPERAGGAAASVTGVLSDTERVAAILREQGALAGSQAFGFAPALVTEDSIDLTRFSALLAWQSLGGGVTAAARDLPPTPIAVQPGQQSVHLRFLVGSALGTPGADLFAATAVTRWAMPLAQELARQLAVAEASVLALPRLPQVPPAALQQGRHAQREVGAQLFASNAIRKLRAERGEPAAVISAHRAASAPGGGELRLSLSCPFAPGSLEGFRCPLFATDRAGDVAAMLVELLRDCRIADVRILPGVHAERDPKGGGLLLFEAAAVSAAAQAALH